MKYLYIAVALLGLTAASCKKSFTDLSPKSSYSDANYYQTTQQFGAAVTAAYAPLRDVVVNDYLMSEQRSDNTIYQSILSNRGTAYTDREALCEFMEMADGVLSKVVRSEQSTIVPWALKFLK